MNQRSRPRLAKTRRARRTLLYLILLVGVGAAIWFFQEQWGLLALLREKASSLTALVGDFSQPRGTIYDRNLKQLAVTLDRVSVYARIQEIKSVPETVRILGEILSLDERELQQKLESSALRVWVAEEISLEQEIAVKSKRLPGIYLQKSEKRFYPNGAAAAHILGYAEDGIGLAGIEHYLDKVQAGGNRPQGQDEARFPPHELVLTLDFKIQELIDSIMAETAKDPLAKNGLACLMESKSGAVIAASQFPGFDPNNFAKFSKEVLANRLTMAIPLSSGIRTFFRDVALLYSDGQAEGARLPWSVRALGSGLGSQLRLWERLRLSDTPPSDFQIINPPGGEMGEMYRAVGLQDPSLSMVPESATPLNILAAMATSLNGGNSVWPHVAAKSHDFREGAGGGKGRGEGNPVVQAPPIPEEAASLFRSLSRLGPANSLLFRDQVPVVRGVGKQAQLQLLEIILASIPAGGHDLLLLMVVEKKPVGINQHNGKKAMILEQLVEGKVERISILQEVAKTVADVVEPEAGEDVNYQDKKGEGAEPRREGGGAAKVRSPITTMPDLHGQSLRHSLRLLQGAHLRIGIRGTGKIVSQKPAAGAPLQGVNEAVLILDKPEEVTPEKMAKRAAAGR